ncbi:unnamed protein product [Adineta steineri]|uniref:Replication-associated protein n=1 Tax=Adineta steineri TaxID=433720 RepID=A0A819MIP7_9BILA|nr:unnamed protein product [Adineta steineri]CAF3979954.1 unnamed protein product [Adineta steineri]
MDSNRNEQGLDNILTETGANDIEYLSQLIIRDLPTGHNEVANVLMDLLDLVNDRKITTSNMTDIDNISIDESISKQIISSHPYPPINQTGAVMDHDRPYADYGHLDTRTIAEECNFSLDIDNGEPINDNETEIEEQQQQQKQKRQVSAKKRLSSKSFAITSWTNVSKEIVMAEIKRQFGIEQIQYACVAKEINIQTNKTHLHIQIILKDKGKKTSGFLDKITNTHCNYQVTDNDRAWNEYIKKGCDYVEFGSFKSTSKRAVQYWPSQSQSSPSSTTPSSIPPIHSKIPTVATLIPSTTTTAAAAAAEEKQKQKQVIARHALDLAKTSINDALIFMRDKSIPTEFLRYASWYKNTFSLIYLLEQYEIAKAKKSLNIVYKWPESFPHCTSTLCQVVDQWLREEFHRTSRAKCLILIGSSGTGKTTFSKSLPGQYTYFKGRWSLNTWNDSANYLIFDDIDWDRFEELGFPLKKDLLTQNGITITTDKYEKTREINVTQPAIILLNPGRPEGALGRQPITYEDQCEATYWQQRATIYRMGE